MSRHGSQVAGGCWVVTRVFMVATELFFFCFYVAIGVPTVSRQCFVFCHDNVATEVPLSRLRRSRQEVRVTTRSWSRTRDFVSRQRFIVSRQDFTELCRDRVFYVATECGQDQRALCRDLGFCVVTELARLGVFLSRQNVFMSRQSGQCWRGFMSRQKILCRDIVLLRLRDFMLRQEN